MLSHNIPSSNCVTMMMRHGIENHPSMASEYVRFLVANSGLSKIDKLEARLAHLEEENKILKRDVAQADKAAKSGTELKSYQLIEQSKLKIVQ